MANCDVRFTLVNDDSKLASMVEELSKETLLAIDLECENNLHHYGSYISLIQISTPGKRNFIVDTITLKKIGGLKEIFENPSIEKIFHDISFDIRILKHEFSCNPKNIFDTELAAVFLGKKDIGLGSLLKQYFDFDKQKKFQMADWTKRPISDEMLCYAIQDTSFLIELRSKLIDELKQKGIFDWFKEELNYLGEKDLVHKEPDYFDIKGFSRLSDKEKTTLKYLFDLREKIAKKVDRPYHFIINNRRLIELAKNPLSSIDEWKSIKGVHPQVKRMAKEFYSAVKKAHQNIQRIPKERSYRYNQKQRDYFALLNRVRDELSASTGLKPFLILNKEQMKLIVLNENFDSLRPWQRKLLDSKLSSSK